LGGRGNGRSRDVKKEVVVGKAFVFAVLSLLSSKGFFK